MQHTLPPGGCKVVLSTRRYNGLFNPIGQLELCMGIGDQLCSQHPIVTGVSRTRNGLEQASGTYPSVLPWLEASLEEGFPVLEASNCIPHIDHNESDPSLR